MLGLAANTAPAAETSLQEYQRLRREAGAAQAAGDFDTALKALQRADDLYPDVPGSQIRLARAHAAKGELEPALENLYVYARMGLTYDVQGDPILRAVTVLAEWPDVARLLADNARPIGKVTDVATIVGEPDFIGEGVVHDGKGLLLSTVSGRTIVRVTATGTAPFLKADAETGAMFGMVADRERGLLWAAEAWGEGVPGGAGASKTGLLKVSLADGTILARVILPDDGGKHQFGDLALAADGTVYASDSVGGGVWRLKAGAKTLDRLVAPGVMASPQGLALCAGGEALMVADYSTGFYRIDLKSGAIRPLQGLMSGAAGADGLVAAPDFNFAMRNASPWPLAVIATQNGVSPQRVRLLRISPDCDEVEDAWTVVANLPGVDDLALAYVHGTTVTFVGHSRWEARAPDLSLAKPDPGPIRVFSAPLSKSFD